MGAIDRNHKAHKGRFRVRRFSWIWRSNVGPGPTSGRQYTRGARNISFAAHSMLPAAPPRPRARRRRWPNSISFLRYDRARDQMDIGHRGLAVACAPPPLLLLLFLKKIVLFSHGQKLSRSRPDVWKLANLSLFYSRPLPGTPHSRSTRTNSIASSNQLSWHSRSFPVITWSCWQCTS
jgi:hypothetical protein